MCGLRTCSIHKAWVEWSVVFVTVSVCVFNKFGDDSSSHFPFRARTHRQSRSTASRAMQVSWTRTTTGQHSFAVNGPRTWNRLVYLQHFVQQNLRYARSVVSWKLTCSSTNLMLVVVMSCATVRRHCDCFIASLAPFINMQTYLLTYLQTHTNSQTPTFQLDAATTNWVATSCALSSHQIRSDEVARD